MTPVATAGGRRVAVIGASGFVGRNLVPALLARGHEVAALTRAPERYEGPGEAVGADLDAPLSLLPALEGVSVVYVLAHSLGSPRFERREARHAEAVALAAAEVGADHVVFLGGLGSESGELSPHLRSRRRVERVLATGPTPVTSLRAGILIGAGSAGWEMLRQTVNRLPLLLSDPRARTRHQPIAVADAVGYLVDALATESVYGRSLEIGGSDVLSYRDMVRRLAVLTKARRLLLEVPWLPHAVAALGAALLTDVDGPTARDLLGSMSHEVVVTNDLAARLLPRHVLGFEAAAKAALSGEQHAAWRAARG